MRLSFPCAFAAFGMLALLVAGGVRAEEPTGRPKALPNVEAPAIKDVTPPELAELPHLLEAPEPEKTGGLYGSAEFLLLTPRQRGLDYAILDPKDDLVPQGGLQSVSYRLQGAFRVGLGYRDPKSGWDVGFFYTNLHSRGDSTAIAPAGGLLYPELTRPGLTDSALTAIASARLDYNIYDLEFGRTMDVDEYMQVRLFSGIRFATIHQSLGALYNGRLADNAYAATKSNFDGAGPTFGSELRWKMGRGFSLFGRANGGLIYGNVRSSLSETNNGGATPYADVSDISRQIVPFAGVGLGISYQYRGLTIRAGYEAVNWFSLIERPTLSNDFSEGKLIPRQSDLSIDGFFLQAGLTF